MMVATVVVGRSDSVSATFEDGTPGPFAVAGQVDFPDDPTSTGHGRVARMRYSAYKTPVEINSSLVFRPAPTFGLGSTVFFRGDLLFPSGTYNFNNPGVDRKLVALRATGVQADSGKRDLYVVLHLYGCGLLVEWSENPSGSACRFDRMSLGRWYHIEMQVTVNHAMAANDGAVRLWVDDSLVFEQMQIRMTNPAWRGRPVWFMWAVGEQRRSADFYGNADISEGGSIDEDRYWDNVAFGTTRERRSKR
jgi:hypothetical protein